MILVRLDHFQSLLAFIPARFAAIDLSKVPRFLIPSATGKISPESIENDLPGTDAALRHCF